MEKKLLRSALLEIGVEEIPASYFASALEQSKEIAEKHLNGRRLAFSGIKLFSTPRRIAVCIEGVEEKSQDRIDEILGPSAKVGRNEKGEWTSAAIGFASKYGIEPDNLILKKTDKGEYLCVQNKLIGEKAEKVLTECFSEILKGLNFPKSMIWEASGFRFARPIRTLVALYGDKKLKVMAGGVKSGNITVVLHASVNKKVTIRSADKYEELLRNACVLADPAERRKVIEKIIDSASKRVHGTVIKDENLLNEIDYLVEHPVAVVGQFDEKFLKLPHEILTNCLAKKQKYFAIEDSKGSLTNSFLGIRNGISENNETVREGYERVLRARLDDAEFFFHKDTATTLYSKLERLKGVMFQEKLGSVYDKIIRIKDLSKYIAVTGGINVSAEDIDRAGGLSKADLVTDMVFEYPELQGVVGRIYGRHDGEKQEIFRAIEEHYWPLNADAKIPSSDLGSVLSLADKIDTLVGDFAAGLIPTGSYDPYGLRRMVVGILRILDEKDIHLSIRTLIEKTLGLLPDKLSQNRASIDLLMDFIRARLEGLLESKGFAFDEVRSVVARGFDDIVDLKKRISALKSIRKHSDFESLATAFKRASNILRQASKSNISYSGSVDADLLSDENEKSLYNDIVHIDSAVKELLEQKDYLAALQKMVTIRKSVDNFFQKVMVMAEDPKIRSNRLALLEMALKPFYSVLDFSLLQGIEK